LWVKVSPELSPEQYAILMRVFHEAGVRAVVATNTLPRPMPDDAQIMAGVGGGGLQVKALEAARLLMKEKTQHGYNVDVIGCGGVMDGATYLDYYRCGVRVVQYWSALVYRGPLAAAKIEDEMRHDAEFADPGRTSLVGN
jgi:dihydroorotate dehydrogenase